MNKTKISAVCKGLVFNNSSFVFSSILYVISILIIFYNVNNSILDNLFFSIILSFFATFFINKLLLLYNIKFRLFLNYFLPIAIGTSYYFATKNYYTSNKYLFFGGLIFVFLLLSNLFEYLNFKNNLSYIYKKLLFLQNLLFSFLISGVIFLGIFISLGSIEHLFDFNFFNDKIARFLFSTFLYVSVLIFIVLSSFVQKYNKYLLKYLNFSIVYLISPLLLIYTTILYIYFIKIIKEWQLPNGEVAWMVTTLCVFSLLSVVYLKSIKFTDKYNYLRVYVKYFPFLLLPLLVLLFLSVFVRIEFYGITEHRYFLCLFATWFLFSFIYIGFIKDFKIKALISSLLFLFALSLISPWNAFRISKNSQQERLQNVLSKNQISIKQNKVQTAHKLSQQDLILLSSVFDYLIKNHGIETLNFIFDETALSDYMQQYKKQNFFEEHLISEAMMKTLNLRYVPQYLRNKKEANFYWNLESNFSKLNIAGSKSFAPFDFYSNSKSIKYEQLELSFDEALFQLVIKNDNTVLGQISLKELTQKASQYKSEDNKNFIPSDVMLIDFNKNKFHIKIWIQNLVSTQTGDNFKESEINGIVFFY